MSVQHKTHEHIVLRFRLYGIILRELQELAGSGKRIFAKHYPDKPTRHCSSVIIARQAVGLVTEVLVDNPRYPVTRQVWTSYEMVEPWCEEARFVGNVVMSFGKEGVETLAEGIGTTACIDETRHIVGYAKAVLCRQRLVEEGIPPRQIPRCDLCVGAVRDKRMLDFRLSPRHGVEPPSLCVTRHDEAFHALPLVVSAPQVAPVARA